MVGVENSMATGIVIGVIGMVMAILNYPMYRKMLNSRKKKYADEIMEMSQKIMDKE